LHAVGVGPLDEARLEFSPGFNVLTGETGAGKTLLVGALSLCLGASDPRGVRHEGDLRAAAVFLDGEEEVAFARESVGGGRLRGTLDGLSTSAEALRARAESLIVIHGQHDSLRLRSRGEVVALVDNFGGIDDSELRSLRARITEIQSRREHFGGDSSAREREIEFLRFQLADIESVAPTSPNELTEVLDRLAEMTSTSENFSDIVAAVELFDGESDQAILAQWARALAQMPGGGARDAVKARLDEIGIEARELVRELRGELEGFELDPETMAWFEERAGALQALARKFGGSLTEVFTQWDEIAQSLDNQESAREFLAELDAQLASLHEQEAALASQLLQARRNAAQRFSDAVAANFERVALAGAQMRLEVSGSDGSQMEVFFRPNPGRAEGSLQSLASGGELSRVLLAISLVTVGDVVAVFDEIDAGVGGSVAQQIGECLAELAQRQQVIVVTHLASVAAKADRHFVVEKNEERDVATTTVREVGGERRISEIARMLSGSSSMRESRELAQRLLEAH
jgi:DNA repair protein RecN (Recombination protein N)